MVGLSVNESLQAPRQIGKGFQTLHRRAIVASMKNRDCRESHEIEQIEGRPFSIQFGKKAEHAPTESYPRERCAARPITSVKRWTRRPGTAGQGALEIRSRRDHDSGKRIA